MKTEILLEFLRLGSKLFHSIIADGKKESLKKLCFILIRGILPSVSYRYEMKKVFWMFIFENFIKEAKFSVPTTKLEGL